jgi:hypothetical protein
MSLIAKLVARYRASCERWEAEAKAEWARYHALEKAEKPQRS